ncbi:MAG: hypothetical protein HYY39_04985 [Armatimonadetes bacterium]|nr:hypothetical protein [Armatimonadota bacterium]MBI2973128.1 hypothetical protein [Armatimonadota bacterium]
MPDHPVDVIGLELDDATRRLLAAGITVAAVSETRPPGSRVVLSGSLRVVRQRATGPRTVELVVTPERYDPATLRAVPSRPSDE